VIDSVLAEFWEERGTVLAQRLLDRCARPAEGRLWMIGHEIADLYKSRRPAPKAACGASDSEAS
jgi:hypothetical protein